MNEQLKKALRELTWREMQDFCALVTGKIDWNAGLPHYDLPAILDELAREEFTVPPEPLGTHKWVLTDEDVRAAVRAEESLKRKTEAKLGRTITDDDFGFGPEERN